MIDRSLLRHLGAEVVRIGEVQEEVPCPAVLDSAEVPIEVLVRHADGPEIGFLARAPEHARERGGRARARRVREAAVRAREALAALVASIPLAVVYGRSVSPWIIPVLMVGFLGFGVVRRVRVYEVFVEGASNVFKLPDFSDTEKMRELFRAFEKKAEILIIATVDIL